MQNRTRMALLTAGLLVGAQIGVAAVGTAMKDAGDQIAPAPGDVQAWEGDTAAEPVEAQSDAAATPGESAQSPTAGYVPNLPISTSRPALQGTAFPRDSDYESRMLPALAEYLDRTEHLRLTGASGNVFPPSTDDKPMLPVLAAYLDEREAVRLAAAAPLRVAANAPAAEANETQEPQTAVTPPAAENSAQESSLLDRILPEGLRNLF